MAKKKKIDLPNNKDSKNIPQLKNITNNPKQEILPTDDKLVQIKKKHPSINWMWHLKALIIIYAVILIAFFSLKTYLQKKALVEVEKGRAYYENSFKMKDTTPILLDSLPESYVFFVKAQNIIVQSMERINELALKRELDIKDYDFFEKTMLPALKEFVAKLQAAKERDKQFATMYTNVIAQSSILIKNFEKVLAKKPLDPKKLAKIAYDNHKLFVFLFERCQYVPAMLSFPSSLEVAVDYMNNALEIDNRCVPAFYYLGKIYELTNWAELSGRYYARAFDYGKNTKYGKEVVKKFNEDLEKYKKAFSDIELKVNTASDSNVKNNLIQEQETLKEKVKQAYYNLGMIYYFDKNENKSRELFENVVNLDPELKSFTAFMAEKRINSIGKKYFEIEYDPRL